MCSNFSQVLVTKSAQNVDLIYFGKYILFQIGEFLGTVDSILGFYWSGMTKLYGYDRNEDGIMLNKRIYWEHPKQDCNSNI